jgi:hypothetical protein
MLKNLVARAYATDRPTVPYIVAFGVTTHESLATHLEQPIPPHTISAIVVA